MTGLDEVPPAVIAAAVAAAVALEAGVGPVAAAVPLEVAGGAER